MNNDKLVEQKDDKEHKKAEGFTDVAYMDVQCHILIKDVDTKEILINKRG